MIIYVAISVIIHMILVYMTTHHLELFSVLSLMGVTYVLPVVMNLVLSFGVISKTNRSRVYCYVFPLISLMAYIVMGHMLGNATAWQTFVQNSRVATGDFYVEVHSNLTDLPQIIFVLLLYFLSEFLYLTFMQRKGGAR